MIFQYQEIKEVIYMGYIDDQEVDLEMELRKKGVIFSWKLTLVKILVG